MCRNLVTNGKFNFKIHVDREQTHEICKRHDSNQTLNA